MPLLPVPNLKIIREETPHLVVDTEQLQLSHIVCGNIDVQPLGEKALAVFLKWSICHSLIPAILHLGSPPPPQEQCRHMSAISLVEIMFQAALCTIANPGNSPNAPYQVNGRQNCAIFLPRNTTQQRKRNDLCFPQQWIKSETLCKEIEGCRKEYLHSDSISMKSEKRQRLSEKSMDSG